MTMQEAAKWISATLTGLYDDREAGAIGALVLEKITGFDRTSRLIRKHDILPPSQEQQLHRYNAALAEGRPVQYVVEEAWFHGARFFVDERVLIPRPETEELVDWVLLDRPATGASVLDLGTGSGCIPCTIKNQRPDLQLRACDISTGALAVARQNSGTLATPVDFFVADMLDRTHWPALGLPDVVISNPPYIPEEHRPRLDRHVAGFEPSIALFVPGTDPLLFYKKIAEWIVTLPSHPLLYLELHHDYARPAADWFAAAGFHTDLRKDFSGNQRIMKAFR